MWIISQLNLETSTSKPWWLLNKQHTVFEFETKRQSFFEDKFRLQQNHRRNRSSNDLLQSHDMYFILFSTSHARCTKSIENANKCRHFFFSSRFSLIFYIFSASLETKKWDEKKTFVLRLTLHCSYFDNNESCVVYLLNVVCFRNSKKMFACCIMLLICTTKWYDYEINKRNSQRWNFLDMKSKTITSNCRMDSFFCRRKSGKFKENAKRDKKAME